MSGSPSKKTTVIYIKNTGHLVAAITRTDLSGPPPGVANLVGDGFPLRIAPSSSSAVASSGPLATFVIPPNDMASMDFDLGELVLSPLGQAINLTVAPSNSVPSQPLLLTSLALFPPPIPTAPNPIPAGSPAILTITPPPSLDGSVFYIVVAQLENSTGFLATATGKLVAPTTAVVLTLPTAPPTIKTFPVLVLVPTIQPYVVTLTIS